MRRLAFLAVAAALTASGCAREENRSAVTVTETTRESTPTAQEDGGNRGDFGAIPAVVRDVEPSVVAVTVDNGEGSGVIWDRDGIIVTNNHVVEGSDRVEVVFATGNRADARVRATDPLSDLAILEVEAESLPAARFSDELPRVGELAVAIGNPLGFENSVTAGIVSGVHRMIPGGGQQTQALVDLIQTDAAISPGNSGGALVNADGEVMGINLAYIPPETGAVAIGFAIPSPTVTDVVRQLLDDGTAEHAFLGVQPAELTRQLAERFDVEADTGILVVGVVEGSAAEGAGVRAGDVILAVDGTPMRRVEDLLALLRRHAPGDEITITITRDGDERDVTVTLIDRPE
jgi:serine protease DegQ